MPVRFFALAAVTAVLAVCAGACTTSSTSPTAIMSISVTGTTPAIGQTSQLKATALLANGDMQDVTATASWVSSNPAVATVVSGGAVTAVAPGNASILATVGSVTGAFVVTISG